MSQQHTDDVPLTNERKPPHWRHSLHFKFLLGQLLLLLLVVSTTIAVILVVERSFLLRQGHDLAEQLGNRMVSELKSRVSLAEALTTSLANFGETVDADVAVYRQVVPHLLNYEGEEAFIAGGGIWPEPGVFTPGVDRRSFFWGRDQAGELIYYDDYNDPHGRGYHNEEWYVPATFCSSGHKFWSKSYVDPHSSQPMVTCTVPMRRDGKLLGVATVDLKLEGLDAFFAESVRGTGGYIFAVDRNNKLLSFPDNKKTRRYIDGQDGPGNGDFLDIHSLAEVLPGYEVIADILDQMNEDLIEQARFRGRYRDKLVTDIAEASYQIVPDEARLLAALLVDPDPMGQGGRTAEVRRVFLEQDPLLEEAVMASVFQMPHTQWKIIVVTPRSGLYAMADAVTRKVALYVVAIELLALLVMFVVLRRIFIRPIICLATDVRSSADDNELVAVRLDDSPQHELGQLAHEFNRKTDNLIAAHTRLAETNLQLKDEIAERMRAAQEKTRLEDQLRQASKLESIGNLAGGVAHDFNNLLSPIIGYSEMLLVDMSPEDPNHEYLAEVLKAAERAEALTRQLLAFARKQVLEMKTVDLVEIISSFEKILRRTIREDIELVVTLPSEASVVRVDRSQIEQILMNLVVNARDALPTGGKIILEVSEEHLDETYARCHPGTHAGRHALLAVSDTGSGMDKQTMDKMFDPFFTTKEVGKGTGLGLATIHGIVKQHHGSIWVYSEMGQGTCFKVYLPLASEPVEADSTSTLKRPEESGNATIVVVEDNDLVRNLVRNILLKEGYDVIVAEDPQQCLTMVAEYEGEIDLLLTDVVMPNMNGRELYQHLDVMQPGLKVIFMSGYADNVIVHHGVLDKDVDFVQKPISQVTLMRKIWDVLGDG